MDEQPPDWERWFLDQKELYRQILDAIADMVLVKGAESRILWANTAFRDYYGMSNQELHDIVDAPFNKVDYTAQYVRDDLHVFTTGQTLDIPEEPVTRHDGTVQIFNTVKAPIRDLQGRVRMTVGVSRNITEQKRIQEDLARYRAHLERLVGERTAELQSLSERLQIVLASLVEGIVAVDAEWRVQLLNPAVEQLTGWTSDRAHGRPLWELLRVELEESPALRGGGPAAAGDFEAALRANRHVSGQLHALDGQRRLVSIGGSPLVRADGAFLGSVVVIRDIALEREVEEQRLRHQKLESVGLLAGGIAHDFNNILTGILGSLSVARLQLLEGTDVSGVLQHAEHACIRAQGLTTQLLTFAKGGAPVKKVLCIDGPVREAAELALRGSSVRLAFRCDPDLPPVEADEGQLAQAINNLVLNSKQAMPEGGEVTIRLSNVAVTDTGGLPLAPGRYVLVSVSDDGPGIAPEHLSRVFDPYFTTRPNGSGLGLASVHSVIRRHGGHVAVSSTVGAGACFTLYVPAASCEAEVTAASAPLSRPQLARKLLVLDDDATVREVMQAILRVLGHHVVVTATSGDALLAFEAAKREGLPFDAVFVDLTMPGDLGGAAVVARLRERDPAARVVVMSGYSTSPVMARARELGLAGTLQKPFTVEMVREVLDRC